MLKRIGLTASLVLFAVYLGFGIYVYTFQDHVYFAYRDSNWSQFEVRNQEIEFRRDGVKLQGWFIDRPIDREHPMIVAFGGQAQDNSSMAAALSREMNNAVLTINHRGFGKSEGKSTETTLFGDAHYVLKEFAAQRGIRMCDVVVLGFSLGSGIATYLAEQEPSLKGVVYWAPFDTPANIAKAHMPFYPGWLIEMAALYPLDSLKRVQGIRIPALFILASKDFLMPNQVSENLFDHYAGPKRMLMFDSDHNGLFITAGVFAASQAFIDHLNAESPVDFRFDESRTVNATDIAGSSLIENWRKFVGLLRLGLQ